MNFLFLLASALMVQVPAEESMELRMVAAGTEGHPVDWYKDQTWVARTDDGEAATISANCPCNVLATTIYEGEWRALVRPTTGIGPGNVAFVQGWSNHHAPPPSTGIPTAPILLVAAGMVTAIAPRFRPKRP